MIVKQLSALPNWELELRPGLNLVDCPEKERLDQIVPALKTILYGPSKGWTVGWERFAAVFTLDTPDRAGREVLVETQISTSQVAWRITDIETGQPVALDQEVAPGRYLFDCEVPDFDRFYHIDLGGEAESYDRRERLERIAARLLNLRRCGDENLSYARVNEALARAQEKVEGTKAQIQLEYDRLRLEWQEANRLTDQLREKQIVRKTLQQQQKIITDKIADWQERRREMEVLRQNPDYRRLRQHLDQIASVEAKKAAVEQLLPHGINLSVINGLRDTYFAWLEQYRIWQEVIAGHAGAEHRLEELAAAIPAGYADLVEKYGSAGEDLERAVWQAEQERKQGYDILHDRQWQQTELARLEDERETTIAGMRRQAMRWEKGGRILIPLGCLLILAGVIGGELLFIPLLGLGLGGLALSMAGLVVEAIQDRLEVAITGQVADLNDTLTARIAGLRQAIEAVNEEELANLVADKTALLNEVMTACHCRGLEEWYAGYRHYRSLQAKLTVQREEIANLAEQVAQAQASVEGLAGQVLAKLNNLGLDIHSNHDFRVDGYADDTVLKMERASQVLSNTGETTSNRTSDIGQRTSIIWTGDQIHDLAARWTEKDALTEEINKLHAGFRTMLKERKLEEFAGALEPLAALERELGIHDDDGYESLLSQLQNELATKDREIREAEQQIGALPQPPRPVSKVEEDLERTQARLKYYRGVSRAIGLALETMHDSMRELQQIFGSRLELEALNILEQLLPPTADRPVRLSPADWNTARWPFARQGVPWQRTYLALRLGVRAIWQRRAGPAPVIIDESVLPGQDTAALQAVLGFLVKYAGGSISGHAAQRQVIILSGRADVHKFLINMNEVSISVI